MNPIAPRKNPARPLRAFVVNIASQIFGRGFVVPENSCPLN
jgi:hypothetical protein